MQRRGGVSKRPTSSEGGGLHVCERCGTLTDVSSQMLRDRLVVPLYICTIQSSGQHVYPGHCEPRKPSDYRMARG